MSFTNSIRPRNAREYMHLSVDIIIVTVLVMVACYAAGQLWAVAAVGFIGQAPAYAAIRRAKTLQAYENSTQQGALQSSLAR